jgi:hypothetical protein
MDRGTSFPEMQEFACYLGLTGRPILERHAVSLQAFTIGSRWWPGAGLRGDARRSTERTNLAQ